MTRALLLVALAACAVDPVSTTEQLDTDCCSLLPDVDAVRECAAEPGTCVELTCGVEVCDVNRHYQPRPFMAQELAR